MTPRSAGPAVLCKASWIASRFITASAYSRPATLAAVLTARTAPRRGTVADHLAAAPAGIKLVGSATIARACADCRSTGMLPKSFKAEGKINSRLELNFSKNLSMSRTSRA